MQLDDELDEITAHRLWACIICGCPFKEKQLEPSKCWYCKKNNIQPTPPKNKNQPEIDWQNLGWVSVAEAAKEMKLPYNTVFNWVQACFIGHVRITEGKRSKIFINLHLAKEFYWVWITPKRLAAHKEYLASKEAREPNGRLSRKLRK